MPSFNDKNETIIHSSLTSPAPIPPARYIANKAEPTAAIPQKEYKIPMYPLHNNVYGNHIRNPAAIIKLGIL